MTSRVAKAGRFLLGPLLALVLVSSVAAVTEWHRARISGAAARELYALVNAEHKRACGSGLAWNLRLRDAARWKAADMGYHNLLSHADAAGKLTFQLYRSAGLGYSAAGEIIAWNSWPVSESVSVAFNSWMASDVHRAQIRSCTYTQVGLGAFRAGDKKWYAAEFRKP